MVVSELEHGCPLGKLLRPGTGALRQVLSSSTAEIHPLLLGSLHRSVPVPGHSNVRPVMVSELGQDFQAPKDLVAKNLLSYQNLVFDLFLCKFRSQNF